jgi:bifunctional non-homologous end joining protein LigD
MSTTRELNGHTVKLSSLEKLLYPDDGLTKEDIINYYGQIAATMLPYMRGRPLNMQRFPDGIDEPGFYQKEVPDYFPEWLRRADVEVLETGEVQPQVVCDDVATLVYLANQATITPHLWLSRAEHLNHPDRLIFDLDPPDGRDEFNRVIHAAQQLRIILRDHGLPAFVMTTGSKGLHVLIPLDGTADFDTSRHFARTVADRLAAQVPDEFTTETRINRRRGRVFLDYLRNAYGQTAVAPYALRPLPGAPVATPLEWSELLKPDIGPRRFHIGNIFRRLGQRPDPWDGLTDQAVNLTQITV